MSDVLCCGKGAKGYYVILFIYRSALISVVFLEVVSVSPLPWSHTPVQKYRTVTAGSHQAQPYAELKLLHLFTVTALRKRIVILIFKIANKVEYPEYQTASDFKEKAKPNVVGFILFSFPF